MVEAMCQSNWEHYPYDFAIVVAIAEIQQEVAGLNTTDPMANCGFEVQLYCFSTLTNIKSKLFPWRGAGGGGLWKEKNSRSMVKAIVQVQKRGRKLTPASVKLIDFAHF